MRRKRTEVGSSARTFIRGVSTTNFKAVSNVVKNTPHMTRYAFRSFKNGSFSSEDDISDLYNAYKVQFRSIRLPPSDHFACIDLRKECDMAGAPSKYSEENVNQAMKDLKRERIFVNGVEGKAEKLRELVPGTSKRSNNFNTTSHATCSARRSHREDAH